MCVGKESSTPCCCWFPESQSASSLMARTTPVGIQCVGKKCSCGQEFSVWARIQCVGKKVGVEIRVL
jgi:hypothetical protein